MASTAVTINIDSSVLAEVETALCVTGGVAVSAANAKAVLIQMIIAQVQAYQAILAAAAYVPTPPVPLATNLFT